MARPTKNGLDYFPFAVDFFYDEKIEAISGEFGIKGEMVAIKLLCAIYREGYFIEWSEMLRMKLLKQLPGVSSQLLDQIVSRLAKWEFFDENLLGSANILTSIGIQKRFDEATKRRINIENRDYWLLNEVNVNINYRSIGINATLTTQSKVKESKGDESKEQEISKTIFHDDKINFSTPTETKTFDPLLTEKKEEKSSAKKEERPARGKLKAPPFRYVVMPFEGEAFALSWQDWKEYKAKEHKFFYKSDKSEQASLTELSNKAGGDEARALAIIQRSMANGWKGFFELKTENNERFNKKARNEAAVGNRSVHDPDYYSDSFASVLTHKG